MSYNGPNPSKRPVPPPLVYKPPPPREATTAKELEEHRKAFEKRLAEKIPANSARIGSVELGGPYAAAKGPSVESQKKIYACGHLNGHHEKSCARVIVERLAHRAYRRPVTTTEVTQLTNLVSQVQKDNGSLEDGLAVAIQAMLLSPHFLFRIESQRPASQISQSNAFPYPTRIGIATFLLSLEQHARRRPADSSRSRQVGATCNTCSTSTADAARSKGRCAD